MLAVIFLIALAIRFLYFPNNIYFGFDQSRDAFSALEIAHGKLKLIGPTTSFIGLNHGVFYYYLLAPLYLIGKMSPEFVAAAFRIFNALGVFLIFYLAKTLFEKRIALIATFLYAVSFEQSQFAIYLGNPTLGSLSVPLMYLGLALAVFRKKYWGLILAGFGLGLSIQLQLALLYLVVPFLLIILFFWRSLIKVPVKYFSFSAGAFLLAISTFILAELKYNFRTIHSLLSLSHLNQNKTIFTAFNTYLFEVKRMFNFNLTGDFNLTWLLMVLILSVFAVSIWKLEKFRKQFIFLGIWFFSLVVTFVINGGTDNLLRDVPLYYPNVGVSISLIVFIAFVLSWLLDKNRYLAAVLTILILTANLKTVIGFNQKGTISEIDVQQGMLLSDQKQLLNYIYSNAGGQPFAVKAVTLPFYVNTTWSYLFEWYGKDKYHYLPIWNGKNALGYPGNLMVEERQEKLSVNRYLIIEPVRGIPDHMISDYLNEENLFTKVVDQRQIGQFVVQKRRPF